LEHFGHPRIETLINIECKSSKEITNELMEKWIVYTMPKDVKMSILKNLIHTTFHGSSRLNFAIAKVIFISFIFLGMPNQDRRVSFTGHNDKVLRQVSIRDNVKFI